MSDLSLMDAIECGIVKLTRVPIADNIQNEDMPKYENLCDYIGKRTPKHGRSKTKELDPPKQSFYFKKTQPEDKLYYSFLIKF